ncbi:NUDIX hydrolase [Sinorhizobium sp. BG8]|uniref:NUDIX hydrolase n=1 Tax=Sinorhizobium sp. BG8 TaxID=2613773 RepID=UPI00193D0F80|nr:NUDIX hydrolase [Sinorhizobium sp. BG8]QRM53814.1 NUDIX hydrolase [Sinorhizobium sp. BG8]
MLLSHQASISVVGTGRSTHSIDQSGALCWRINPETSLTEVLLVASLRTGQWGIPKGHLEHDETSVAAAVREAFEEAGAIGSATAKPVGKYTYSKGDGQTVFRVTVHLIHVVRTAEVYPEKHLRQSRWVSTADLPEQITRPMLRRFLLEFLAKSVQP